MALRSIVYRGSELKIINQLLLPGELKYEDIRTTEDAFKAIKEMQIRGAPAIAILAMLSIAVESKDLNVLIDREKLRRLSKLDYLHYLKSQTDYLCSSRPTAVNIRNESDKLIKFYDQLIDHTEIELEQSVDMLIKEIEKLPEQDLNLNKSIGKHGADAIIDYWASKDASVQQFNVLTICNTGSLATCGYGTALGIVRRLNELDKLKCCYATETRPYNQGSRLTAYELSNEKINSKLICDNMVASLMKKETIHAVVVGADRLVMNGDFANKIGTYQLAVLSKNFNVPFYVACPLSTIDTVKQHGDEIVIEQRPSYEMRFIGSTRIAPDEIECWNPAFDVVDCELTTLIITEVGSIPTNSVTQLVSKHLTNI